MASKIDACWLPLPYSLPVVLLHAGCARRTIGRRCARKYISCILRSASERITLPTDMKNLLRSGQKTPTSIILCAAYPNVAPEPAIYCPSVLITPLGPAPYRKMVTVPATVRNCSQYGLSVALPKMNPMIRPTATGRQSSCKGRLLPLSHTASHHSTHFHCSPSISL